MLKEHVLQRWGSDRQVAHGLIEKMRENRANILIVNVEGNLLSLARIIVDGLKLSNVLRCLGKYCGYGRPCEVPQLR